MQAAWLFVAGAGNIVGLLFEYTAVRSGKVGVVAAIASTEGAVAALLSAFAGEPISAGVAVTLALIATGIVLASLERTDDDLNRRSTKAIVLAFGAALSFGVSLYSVGHVSGDVAFAWLLIPARLVGVVVITLPLAIRGTLRIARRATPFVLGRRCGGGARRRVLRLGGAGFDRDHVGPRVTVRGDLGRRRVLLLR